MKTYSIETNDESFSVSATDLKITGSFAVFYNGQTKPFKWISANHLKEIRIEGAEPKIKSKLPSRKR